MKSNSLPEPRNALLVVASTAVLAVGAVCQTSPVVCWQDELVGTSAAVTHWHHGGLVSINENDGFILDCKSITSNRLWSYRWKGHSYSLLKRRRGKKIYKTTIYRKLNISALLTGLLQKWLRYWCTVQMQWSSTLDLLSVTSEEGP